jgi:type VI protein secretion system component VasK
MSSIKEMKASVDVKLDKLDARADAFQAALAGSKAQTDERIQYHRQAVRQALDKLATDIDRQTDLPVERKESIRSLVDNLNEQIASSQAAAHETLASARQQMHEVMQKIETQVDTTLAGSKSINTELLHASVGTYARSVHKLDAALEAAEARFTSVKDKVDAAFDKRRQEMAQEIAEFRMRLDEKTAHNAERLANFEAELHDKFEQIAKAFKDLFG